MITKFSLLDLSKPYFWESDNALVEVRFTKAVIGTHDGEITYYATLPNGEQKTITDSAERPIKIYNSTNDYLTRVHPTRLSVSLENIARHCGLAIRYRELDGERVGFHFVVWTIDGGITKEHKIYAGTINVTPNTPNANNNFEINDDFPENYHKDRETMEKLHATKVIAEDGTESTIGGELSSIILSDEQKSVLDEWLAVTKKLEEANITIISSESTGEYLAVNNTNVDRVYGYEESYDGIISLAVDKVPELHIPKVPLMVCNDYDSNEMWILMKGCNE